MTPAARLAAVIELVSEIETAIGRQAGPPADVIIQRYFRQRRYAGSGDRAAVGERVYAVLRRRGELVWRLMSAGCQIEPRALVLLETHLEDGLDAAGLFEGSHAADPPDAEQRARLDRAVELSDPPAWAAMNLPEWLAERVIERFGEAAGAEMAAMAERAPLDLRVNTLRTTRDAVATSLAEANIQSAPTPYSPVGLRLTGWPAVAALDSLSRGDAEIQDEGSQLAALLTGAAPGEQVGDLCAGAGGKTLAMAAMMANSGQIYAMDIDKKRLGELKRRADRAGLRNLQIDRVTTGEPKRTRQLAPFAGRLDLAVVDAPCSGSGTWRRNPDLRWRLDPERLAEHGVRQRDLLLGALDLVRPGGRVAYIACSILREEGEDVVDAVLAARMDAELIDCRRQAEQAGLTQIPPTAAEAPESLLLTPARHGTDGFFVALFRRIAD